MELKKDLLAKQKKTTFRIVLGILFIVFAGAWLFIRIAEDEKIRVFDWGYSIVFMLNGIFHIYSGYGYNINALFGKAFILINNELISIKAQFNKKEETVYLSDIQFIDFKYHQLTIKKTDDTNLKIDLTDLAFDTQGEIKKILAELSEDKNISYRAQ
ncbi:hypothetical protein [uncultured Draconibacterium sp.]|uniref:hypothetical protein n=1 Tax=uncultured Draconibacterium sp. TaxID=1573823 RepID=UPI0025EB447F|nr:hypothetical protein [uncultured Draconibacterium sp.]